MTCYLNNIIGFDIKENYNHVLRLILIQSKLNTQ